MHDVIYSPSLIIPDSLSHLNLVLKLTLSLQIVFFLLFFPLILLVESWT